MLRKKLFRTRLMYETLIMSAAISSIFADQLTEAGKAEDAATFRRCAGRRGAGRRGAGELFEKLVGVPAQQMEVRKDGRISGLAE